MQTHLHNDGFGNKHPTRLQLIVLLVLQLALIGVLACASRPKSSQPVSATEPAPADNSDLQSMLGGSKKSHKAKRPGTVPGEVGSSPNSDLDQSQEQQAFQQILQGAKNGGIQYYVPPNMTVGTQASVDVEIYGANASAELKKQFQANGSGTLKVITPMLVELSQPDNPGAFKIVPDSTKSGDQFLPDDGKADWVWSVTPLQAGPEKLRIDAYMVLNAKLPDGQPMMREVQSYTVQVPVKVRPRLQTVGDFFATNWDKLLGFILPSGAGVIFILWLISRRKGKPTP